MNFKRILSVIMAVIMCFAICACESSSKSSDSKKDNKTSSSSKDKNDDDSDAKDMSGGLVKPIEEAVAGYDNYSDGAGANNNDTLPGSHSDYGEEEQGPRTDAGIDTSGLSAKHGKAYEYLYTQSGYNSDGTWDYTDQDGYIHDGDMVMERILTVYRFSDRSEIEYMLEFAGEWGEYWHVSYNFPADCVYFDYIEGGTVTISDNQAVWEDDSGQYREIYTLKSTREFDN